MASYTQENDIVGGGSWMGGGVWAMVLLVVVVLWTLFKDGHRDGRDGFANFGGCGCGPCVQPTFKDESNFEEERNINSKLCKVDENVHCEGEKTRALIEQNYIQDLRDKLAEVNMEKLTLKQEMFTEKKFDQLNAQFCKTDAMIAALACELPKRPPIFAECVTPNTHHTDCEHRGDFPRRGRCDGFGFDGCCC